MCKVKSVTGFVCAWARCVCYACVCVHMWLQNIIWNIAHAVVVVIPMIKNKRLFACCIRLHSVSHPLSALSFVLPRWQPKRRRDQQQPKQLIHTQTHTHTQTREGICHTHTQQKPLLSYPKRIHIHLRSFHTLCCCFNFFISRVYFLFLYSPDYLLQLLLLLSAIADNLMRLQLLLLANLLLSARQWLSWQPVFLCYSCSKVSHSRQLCLRCCCCLFVFWPRSGFVDDSSNPNWETAFVLLLLPPNALGPEARLIQFHSLW